MGATGVTVDYDELSAAMAVLRDNADIFMSAGADEASAWADLRVGEGRQWEDVRLRANQPHQLADGTFLTLVAVAPPPHTRRIALEISTPDETATR